MKPYYSDDHVTLYGGDALAVLASLPTASVDAVVTDPPYSSGGMMRGDRAQEATHRKYSGTVTDAGQLVGFSGDSRDQRSYAYWAALWLSECYAAGGVCWVAQIGRPRSAGNTVGAWPSYLNRRNREDFGL